MNLTLRKSKLHSLKLCIVKHETLLMDALKADLGKSQFESYLAEIGFVIEDIDYSLKNIDSWAQTKKVSTPITLFPAKSYVIPEPKGKVLIIAPWNYPFQLSLAPLVGAIVAGNSVSLKPSEFAVKTAEAIKLIIDEVFTASEAEVFLGGVEITQSLLSRKFDHIFFTGSTQVGKIVMKAAAEHLTPVTLELGGKSPFLIEESANIDLAAKRCAWGKFMNAGQTCVAPDYVLVPEKMRDEFVTRLKYYVQLFYGAQPEISEDYGRIINERHLNRLTSLLPGSNIVMGGTSIAPNFLAPTALQDVNWEDKVMEEEIFGPILPILIYQNLEEAIEKINQRPKPLAFYLFSETSHTIDDILKKVSFGGGCVNDTVVHLANPDLPFGGVGDSGMGSYHGLKSFETFSHFKSVVQNTTLFDIPLRYPPFKGKLGWIKKILG